VCLLGEELEDLAERPGLGRGFGVSDALIDLCVDLAVLAVPDRPDLRDLDPEVPHLVLHDAPHDTSVPITDGDLAVADKTTYET